MQSEVAAVLHATSQDVRANKSSEANMFLGEDKQQEGERSLGGRDADEKCLHKGAEMFQKDLQ